MTIASLIWLQLAGPAHAQDESTAVETAPEAAPAADAAGLKGVNLRYRYMFLPNTILNSWYFDAGDEGALDFDRPKISASVFGAEFALEPSPASFLFYAEYWKINWGPGYWDDVESPADHVDGDWLAPHKLGMVALGVNFGREFAVTPDTKPTWLGFYVGGGFGLGILTGRVDQWRAGYSTEFAAPPDCGAAMPAYNRKDLCDADSELGIPPVAPVLDLTLGWRLNISERANVRLETGLHDMIFFGMAAGAYF